MELFNLSANLSIDISEFEKAINEAKALLEGLKGFSMPNLPKPSTSDYEQSIKDAQGILEDLATSVENAFNTVTTVATGAMAGATALVGDFIKNSVTSGSNFEATLSEVQAISGATDEELAAMKEMASELGATTKFTSAEVAEGFKYMAMAGWKTQSMLEGITGVVKLAGASGEDLGTTSDIVTDAITAFGLKAEDVGEFVDILAATSSNANTNVHMMGETFKYAASVAGSLGYTIEDVAVATGIMANAGVKDSQAGTTLRSMFTRMATGAGEAGDAMSVLGINMSDSEGNAYSFMEVMEQLREAFQQIENGTYDYDAILEKLQEKLDAGIIGQDQYDEAVKNLQELMSLSAEEQSATYASQIAGQGAMSGFLALVQATTEDFEKLKEAVDNANGSVETMYATMTDNLQGDIDIMNSSMESLQNSIYDQIEPSLRSLAESATGAIGEIQTKLVEYFEQDETQEKLANLQSALETFLQYAVDNIGPIIDTVTTGIGAVVEGITFLIEHFDAIKEGVEIVIDAWIALQAYSMATKIANVATTVGTILTSTGSLAGAIELLISPVGLVVAAVAVAAVEIVEHWDEIKVAGQAAWEWIQLQWDNFTLYFNNLFNEVKGKAEKWKEAVENFFVDAWKNIKVAWVEALDWFQEKWDGIKGGVEALKQTIEDAFTGAYDWIVEKWGAVTEWFQGILDGVGAAFGQAKYVITGAINTAWDDIVAVWETVVEWFQGIWDQITAGLPDISQAFTDAWAVVEETWNAAVEWFSELWAQFAEDYPDIAAIFVDAWDAIVDVWDAAKDYFADTWKNIAAAFDMAVEFFAGLFTDPWTTTKETWDKAVEYFSGILDDVIEVFEGIADDIKEKFQTAWDNVTGIWDGVSDYFKGIADGVVKWFVSIPDFFKGRFELAITYIQEAWKSIVEWFQGIADSIVQAFLDIPGRIIGVGKDVVKGVGDGIYNAAAYVGNGVLNVGNAVADGFAYYFDIGSPSKLMRDEYGYNIGAGVALGIEDSIKTVEAATEKLEKAGVPEFGTFSSGSASLSQAGSMSQIMAQQAAQGSAQQTVVLKLGEYEMGRAVYDLYNRRSQEIGLSFVGT